MEDSRKPDFKKHASPRASKWYLLKIIFYIILLSLLIYLLTTQSNKEIKTIPNKAIENIQEIDAFELEDDSLK